VDETRVLTLAERHRQNAAWTVVICASVTCIMTNYWDLIFKKKFSSYCVYHEALKVPTYFLTFEIGLYTRLLTWHLVCWFTLTRSSRKVNVIGKVHGRNLKKCHFSAVNSRYDRGDLFYGCALGNDIFLVFWRAVCVKVVGKWKLVKQTGTTN